MMLEILGLIGDIAAYLGLILTVFLAICHKHIRKDDKEALWFLCWAIFFSVAIH